MSRGDFHFFQFFLYSRSENLSDNMKPIFLLFAKRQNDFFQFENENDCLVMSNNDARSSSSVSPVSRPLEYFF